MSMLFEITLTAAFIGGLAGGVHCAGMCGGIVHAMCARRGDRGGFRYLAAYNAGRIASYVCAGALAGTLGAAGLVTRAEPVLQPLLFALASLMLVALGLYLAGMMPMMARIEAAGAWLWRGIQPWTGRLLPVTSLPRALALGALWGWLPCGMVYAVLLIALSLGSAGQGALVMLAFGLGTLPNLLGVGLLWRHIGGWRRARVPRVAAGFAVALFGAYGLAHAMHPATLAGGELLCYTLPGLADILR